MDIWINSIRFIRDDRPEEDYFIINNKKVFMNILEDEVDKKDEGTVYDGHYYCNYILDKNYQDIIPCHNFFIYVNRYTVEKRGFIEEPKPRFINYAYTFQMVNKAEKKIKLTRNGWALNKFIATTRAVYTLIGGYQDDWNSNLVLPVITDLKDCVIVKPEQKLEHFKSGGFEISLQTFLNVSNVLLYSY